MIALLRAARAWRLADLLANLGEPGPGPTTRLGAAADLGVVDIALDSRQVVPGTLFLALPGGATHGMAYTQHARSRGAVAVLAEPSGDWNGLALAEASARLGLPVIPVPGLARLASLLGDRFYGEPSAHLEVIGVAGANGKNSIAHFLAQTLAAETRCALTGTLGTGFPGDLGPAAQPDALSVQDTLARLRSQGAQAVAMAVSDRTLARESAAAVRFRHAIVTRLRGDEQAVGRLLRTPGLASAVLNTDDAQGTALPFELAEGCKLALYGMGPRPPSGWRCDLWVGLRGLTPLRRGLRLHVLAHGPEGTSEGKVEVGVLGACNAANLLAVLAVLLARGLTLASALHALARVQGVPGRMEGFGGAQAPLVAVDSARTPEALGLAIANLRRHGAGRLITVVGCRGKSNPAQRPLMGATAEAASDLVILTDDNPGGEDGDAILSEMLQGMRSPAQVRRVRQRALAIRIALTLAGPADSVLVAGKGHETTQDMGDLKVRFSDRAQVVQALTEWKGRGQATVCDWEGRGQATVCVEPEPFCQRQNAAERTTAREGGLGDAPGLGRGYAVGSAPTLCSWTGGAR
jgi:UDP-N-acetylmuramoyl-L-alanyl-D-glutamate--2,6-diaminopimelate ligase